MKTTQDEIVEDKAKQSKDAERAESAAARASAMIGLMRQYGILIPARSIANWRPTKRVHGSIDGVHDGLELIATDGVLGWFITRDGIAWLGHIQCFSGLKEGKVKVSKPRKKSKRREILDSL